MVLYMSADMAAITLANGVVAANAHVMVFRAGPARSVIAKALAEARSNALVQSSLYLLCTRQEQVFDSLNGHLCVPLWGVPTCAMPGHPGPHRAPNPSQALGRD